MRLFRRRWLTVNADIVRLAPRPGRPNWSPSDRDVFAALNLTAAERAIYDLAYAGFDGELRLRALPCRLQSSERSRRKCVLYVPCFVSSCTFRFWTIHP